jgi:ABC-type nickel/cobalt efflux system permease component RcnA
MISENKMFLSMFFGLVWFGWERERRKRERERDKMVQRVQRTATTTTHKYTHTHTHTLSLFQSCHLQRHVSKVPFAFIDSFMQN